MLKNKISEPFHSYLENYTRKRTTNSSYSAAGHLRHFSNFLEANNLKIEEMQKEHLGLFAEYLKVIKATSPASRLTTRKAVQTCLVRLCLSKKIDRDYRDWYPNYKHWPHIKFKLPQEAQDYLDLMVTITKPSSRARYRIDLARLHQFLKEKNIPLKDIKRSHVESLLKRLHKKNVSASTKIRAVLTLRKYFHWLSERNYITEDPDVLLTSKDCPQKPTRLPRPLQPTIDKAVQSKLTTGSDIFYDALKLMRTTGLRVGEIRDLEFNCLTEDYKGNIFLKVPIGKLNTERRVPLTAEMVLLIKKIQNQSIKHARKELPERLIIAPSGRKAIYYDFRSRMDEIQTELGNAQTVQSHQLRHSCATDLLNHGMNIVALKEFLGHKDIRMTLNYAAVAPEKIKNDYFEAINKIQEDYKIKVENRVEESIETILNDLILRMQNQNNIADKKKSQNIIRTLTRISKQIKK